MNRISRLAGAGAAAMTMTALFAAPAVAGAAAGHSARPAHHGGAHRGSVFVQTDDPSGNAVVAYRRDAHGALHLQGTYPTDGTGGMLTGSVVDHLASQGAMHYDAERRLLYVVNAGSNTITVFRVHGSRLELRQVIGTNGDFPVSLAVHGDALYVLNARGGGSVQGFFRLGDRLVRIPSWHRALDLDASATPEFTHTPGQVTFGPDGSQLLVTTKANTNAVDVFPVDRFGGLSGPAVVNSLPGAVPFAMTFDPRGHLVVAEAGTNSVATFALRGDGTISTIATAPTGQAATCWVVGNDHDVYASNAGSASVSGFRIARDGSTVALGNTATDKGTIDAAVSRDGRYLYVQAGADGLIDEYRIASDGSLTQLGSVSVPGGAGADGIAAG